MSRQDERDAAYVEFVRARGAHLRRIAYACCGDWHRAEDVLQTALIKLYVAWPRVRHDGREEAYVRTIIVRANVDESRRPWRRERSRDVLPERPAAEQLPVEERDALFDALQALPEMQRKTVLLRHCWACRSRRPRPSCASTRARSRATPREAWPRWPPRSSTRTPARAGGAEWVCA